MQLYGETLVFSNINLIPSKLNQITITVIRLQGNATLELRNDDPENFKRVQFHSANLVIQKIQVFTDNGAVPFTFEYAEVDELLIFNLTLDEPPAKLYINVEYSTTKGSWLERGAYKLTPYSGIATFFEPAKARTVFPCFDEPYFRTIYSLNLQLTEDTYDEHDLVLFNSPETDTTLKSAKKQGPFRFKETVPMPSYLVGLAIFKSSEHRLLLSYHYKDNYTEIPIRLFSCEEIGPEYLDQLEVAINFTLAHCTKMFGVGWKMSEKIDLLVTLHQFGGMEQPGLIPIQNNYVNQNPSALVRVTIHELIHQWTGNKHNTYVKKYKT